MLIFKSSFFTSFSTSLASSKIILSKMEIIHKTFFKLQTVEKMQLEPRELGHVVNECHFVSLKKSKSCHSNYQSILWTQIKHGFNQSERLLYQIFIINWPIKCWWWKRVDDKLFKFIVDKNYSFDLMEEGRIFLKKKLFNECNSLQFMKISTNIIICWLTQAFVLTKLLKIFSWDCSTDLVHIFFMNSIRENPRITSSNNLFNNPCWAGILMLFA